MEGIHDLVDVGGLFVYGSEGEYGLSIKDRLNQRVVWSTSWEFGCEENRGAGTGILECEYCCTKFRIEFRYYEGVGWARFVDKLKELGKGLGDAKYGMQLDLHLDWVGYEPDSLVKEFEFDDFLAEANRGKVFQTEFQHQWSWAEIFKEWGDFMKKDEGDLETNKLEERG